MNSFKSNLRDCPDILTPIQLKEFLNVGKNRIYDMLQTGEIKSIRIGKQYWIPKKYINIYLNQG